VRVSARLCGLLPSYISTRTGTELIPPKPNTFLLCRGPGDILTGGNKCIEIAYPLLALPVLNGAVFLGLLALKKFQDEQEEPPSPGNKK
jgi:hypothetical protein